jgi:hypothetical protein
MNDLTQPLTFPVDASDSYRVVRRSRCSHGAVWTLRPPHDAARWQASHERRLHDIHVIGELESALELPLSDALVAVRALCALPLFAGHDQKIGTIWQGQLDRLGACNCHADPIDVIADLDDAVGRPVVDGLQTACAVQNAEDTIQTDTGAEQLSCIRPRPR